MTNIILITNSKIKTNANLNLAFGFQTKTKLIDTASIQIFKDKELTNKLYSFEKASFDLEKTDKLIKGIKFDLTNMTNKESANNFFTKIAKKISNGIYFLYFSSLPGCDVLSKKNPAINLNVVQIGLVSLTSENFYMTISFAEGESSVDKYSKQINDECQSYSNLLKNKLSEFYELASNYFKVKKEKENVKSKEVEVVEKNKKQEQALKSVNTENRIQVEKLDKDKADLEQTTRQKNELENELKRKYSDLNNIKAGKAKFEKELEELKKQSETMNKEIDENKNNLESFDKSKEEKLVELNVQNAQISDTQKKIEDMDKTLKAQKDEFKKVSDNLMSVNSQVTEAQSGIVDNKMLINSEQTNIDNLKNADSQNEIKKKNMLFEDMQKKLDELKKELSEINKEVLDSEENMRQNSQEANGVLNDPNQKTLVKQERLNNIMINIKEYMDNTKKLFPLLPDIYWDNIWRFVSVNHSEALNYLKGMRPSIYGLYDNLYTKKHPEKTINDVDFVPRPLPEIIAKAKRLKKRKI